MQDQHVRSIRPFANTDACPNDVISVVFDQRCTGTPIKQSEDLIYEATGLSPAHICHVHLAAEKYENGMPIMCHIHYKQSGTRILNRFLGFDEYVKKMKKRQLHRVYIVQDEFSGYAGFTCIALTVYGLRPNIALTAYGLRPNSRLLCYKLFRYCGRKKKTKKR